MRIILAVLMLITLALATPFCDGFKAGYKDGYCYGKAFCTQPLSPLCPLPRMGENSYMGGYNRGFLVGLSRQR